MKIPDRTETQKKVARTMNPISLSVMLKSMEMIYFPQVTLLQHQQVQNIPQLRNLSRNYLFGWSFLIGVKYDQGIKYDFVQEIWTKISYSTFWPLRPNDSIIFEEMD
ncbi:hypothetical protein BpHYR1_048082 [Brachionus plicatilis]|uniref:Uncharacterized protein n=1 Tax=Brachionus plicatilis TaxID=10195 RepID=A0A3M7PXT6_BRAPC|nr:hypothetical protein BpHYR1_048082 [Brachionus plicatilis]